MKVIGAILFALLSLAVPAPAASMPPHWTDGGRSVPHAETLLAKMHREGDAYVQKAAFAIFQAQKAISGPVLFVPPTGRQFFWIAPAADGGSDANDGLAKTVGGGHGPLLTPHGGPGFVCGDAIIAVATANLYQSNNFTGSPQGGAIANWQQPTSCPSTTGGIDGLGGIYATSIVCEVPFGCTSNGRLWVDRNNWMVSGFVCEDTTHENGECFDATPQGSYLMSYVAFVNNLCTGAALGCFNAGGLFSNANFAVDHFASMGNMAYNGAQNSSECGSNFGDNVPVNVDTYPGTHIAFIGNFGWKSLNGPALCGVNSNFFGGFPTVNGLTSGGSTTITLNGTVGTWTGAAVQVVNPATGFVVAGAITTPTWITSISGQVITLSTALAGSIANGATLSVGLTTDGNGLIFDTWGLNPYTKQAYVAYNFFFGNGSTGTEYFCGGGNNCTAGLTIIDEHNTLYGNFQDYAHAGQGGEINFNISAFAGTFTYRNNIVQSSVTTPFGSPSAFKNLPSTGNGMGNAIVAAFLNPNLTVTGNYFKSAAGATCPLFGTCNGTNDVSNFNGANYNASNTLGTDPLFANVAGLPTGKPSCTGQLNIYTCATALGIIASLTPTQSGVLASGAGAAVAMPTTCVTNALYPTWTKALNWLYWNGTAMERRLGLTPGVDCSS